MTKKKKPKSPDLEEGWSTSAKVGAAVGSAALMGALLYAGKRHLSNKKGKLEPASPESEDKPVTPTRAKKKQPKPESD